MGTFPCCNLCSLPLGDFALMAQVNIIHFIFLEFRPSEQVTEKNDVENRTYVFQVGWKLTFQPDFCLEVALINAMQLQQNQICTFCLSISFNQGLLWENNSLDDNLIQKMDSTLVLLLSAQLTASTFCFSSASAIWRRKCQILCDYAVSLTWVKNSAYTTLRCNFFDVAVKLSPSTTTVEILFHLSWH